MHGLEVSLDYAAWIGKSSNRLQIPDELGLIK